MLIVTAGWVRQLGIFWHGARIVQSAVDDMPFVVEGMRHEAEV